jgi:hypothetical protein
MSFWTQEFMDNRRNQWLNALARFEYQVGGAWYEAKINAKRITGTKLEIVASLPRTSEGSQTITAVRIIDVTGKQCGYQATNVKRAANQGVLAKFEFPIYEKEGEN